MHRSPPFTRRMIPTLVLIAFILLSIVGKSSMVTGLPGGSRRDRRGATVRLHLVRHGETEANEANFVLGQRESPLTEKGIRQAAALGASIGHHLFWRAYSSDYERTRKTAGIILAGGNFNDGSAVTTGSVHEVDVLPNGDPLSVDTSTVISDRRLRERAKGVREGRPKILTYEEALALYREEHGEEEALPLLESDDDVWERVKSWIDDLVHDASTEKIESSEAQESLKNGYEEKPVDSAGREYEQVTDSLIVEEARTDRGNSIDPRLDESRNVYEVLAVSHSATIRTAVNRLVGNQLPSNIIRGSGGRDGATTGQLIVPNTSRTIIDIIAKESEDADEDGKSKSANDASGDDEVEWSAKLVELTNTDHISPVQL